MLLSIVRVSISFSIACKNFSSIFVISLRAGVEQIVALAAVSVHRCCLIVRPMTAQKMTSGWAVLFIALTWTYSLVVSLPPAVGWNSFVLEGIGTGRQPAIKGSKQCNFFIL